MFFYESLRLFIYFYAFLRNFMIFYGNPYLFFKARDYIRLSTVYFLTLFLIDQNSTVSGLGQDWIENSRYLCFHPYLLPPKGKER